MHRSVAALLLLMACSLAGCSQVQNTTTPSGDAQTSTLRVAIEQDAKSLDPILSSSTVDGFVQRLMFEPLLSADASWKPVPMLALEVPSLANGGISADGLTVTYHLRRNAKWTDGVPVTSDDVKFSWTAIMNPQNNAISRHGYEYVSRIDTPDPWTVIVHLRRPFAPFVNTFFAESDQPYTVIPAHVLRRYQSINQIPFNDHPTVTDGPFKLVAWVHGDHLSFVRNDGFFMGKPSLANIDVKVVPDENTGMNLMRAHEIDFMDEPSIATHPSLHVVPGVKEVWVNANAYVGIGFNLSHPPLNDPRVRRALSLAIDKTEIVRTATYGQEQVATADLPGWMWGEDPALRVQTADVDAARALLAQAGVHNLNVTLVSDVANVTFRRVTVQLQEMLQRIGVSTTVKYFPADFLYAQASIGGILQGGHYDLTLVPWYGGIDPDNSSQFSCASMPPNGYNMWRYCTPEMDALQREALATNDPERRRVLYHEIEDLVARDEPIDVLWWVRQQEVIDSRLQGFAPNPVNEAWNAWQWHW